jgi:uncharacterized membrane protein (DUF2068 family)
MLKKFDLIFVIAVERLIRALLTIYVGIEGLYVTSSRNILTEEFQELIRELSALNQGISNFLLHSRFIDLLFTIITIPSYEWITIFVLITFYGLVVLLESIGLILKKQWGIILTFTSTCLWIPVEIYELWHQLQIWKVVIFFINLFILIYLGRRIFTNESK